MPFARSDLADLAYFLAITRRRSFQAAGLDLGISASALSHSLKGLEARLGVRLMNRTNRSVTLTAAGEELRDAVGGPLDAVEQAIGRLERFRDTPVGRIRLNVLEDAATLLLGPVLPVFSARYPEVEIDLSVDNRRVDVTDQGFDAGIRYGDTVPADMIAQRLSAEIRWIVAAAPSYVRRFGEPSHPRSCRSSLP